MTQELEQTMCRLIEDVLNLKPGAVQQSSSMETLEAWDSLQHLGIVLALEDEFNCTFSPEEMTAAVSVDLLVKLIESKRRGH